MKFLLTMLGAMLLFQILAVMLVGLTLNNPELLSFVQKSPWMLLIWLPFAITVAYFLHKADERTTK